MRAYAKAGVKMSRCRHCDHDLYVVRHGADQGEIRCSNPSCPWAVKPYKMGKNTNEGLAVS